MQNVLITGGAGYVGAVLVPKLLKKGYRVTVLDWYIYGDSLEKHRNLKEIEGDLRNLKEVKEALADVDAVIHLACISNDPSFELDTELGKSVNYDATVQLFDLSQNTGVKRFIYASTSSVYGVKKEKEVTEDLPLEPLTDYSKYKAESEAYLLKRVGPLLQGSDPVRTKSDMMVLILRPSTVCGYSPRLRLDLTVNMLTIQALVNKKITVFGGGQKRPNIHIEDMTDLYVKTLEYPREKIHGKIYNAGYDNFTVMEIAQMVQKVLKDPDIEIVTTPTNDNRSYHVSSKKIEKELGFKARRSVEDAIRDIKIAFEKGLIPNSMTDSRYYNIKMMQTRGFNPIAGAGLP